MNVEEWKKDLIVALKYTNRSLTNALDAIEFNPHNKDTWKEINRILKTFNLLSNSIKD